MRKYKRIAIRNKPLWVIFVVIGFFLGVAILVAVGFAHSPQNKATP
jgi:hypothetical protein